MTHFQTDVFLYEDGRFEDGYKPGTIRVRQDVGLGGMNLHIMTEDPREQLKQLRDLCQAQIEALDALSVSAPADPEPIPQAEALPQGQPVEEHVVQVPVEHQPDCMCPSCNVPF